MNARFAFSRILHNMTKHSKRFQLIADDVLCFLRISKDWIWITMTKLFIADPTSNFVIAIERAEIIQPFHPIRINRGESIRIPREFLRKNKVFPLSTVLWYKKKHEWHYLFSNLFVNSMFDVIVKLIQLIPKEFYLTSGRCQCQHFLCKLPVDINTLNYVEICR